MLGIIVLFGFLLSGILFSEGIFRSRSRSIRLWMGTAIGFVLSMWTPSLFAFFFRFTRQASLCGLALSLLIGIGGWLFGKRKRSCPSSELPVSKWLFLLLVLPLTLLFAYLQHTHYFREVAGALHVGQSTYGDICMHAAIATSLPGSAYPPEYSILPGTRMGYPFLIDALSATMLLFGSSLRISLILPGILLGVLAFSGFVLLSLKFTKSTRAAALAFLLFFLNGGLGFAYPIDRIGQDASAFKAIFSGFYLTPTNMPDLNLRWVNVLCDMLLPQRTFLAGFALLLPALWLLFDGIESREKAQTPTAQWLFLGIFAGTLPMIHTHSFLALGLISIGLLAVLLVRKANPAAIKGMLLYGTTAVLLALPQLIVWTFPQTGSSGALQIWPGWVNNTGYGLRDGTIWFWLKNMGPVFLLLIPAAVAAPKNGRALCAGAVVCFVVANFVQFQTLLYDNNKLMYAAYAVLCPFTALYCVQIFDRLSGLSGRRFLAGCFVCVSILSACLTIGREVVSDYQIFSADEVAAAEFLQNETPQGATVLTGRQHNNLASVLAGRNVVCGPDNFLGTHGLSYSDRTIASARMLSLPAENLFLFAEYDVDYVVIGPSERYDSAPDSAWFARNLTCIYENTTVRIYSLETLQQSGM